MTKNETLEILAIIKVAYPQQLGKISDIEAGAMVELWADTFARVPKAVMQIAVKKIVMQSKFFPSIADMCEALDEMNKDAYCKLTYGRYTDKLGLAELEYSCKMDEAELAAFEKCGKKDFSRYDFKVKYREENPFDKEQFRSYDDATERNLEFIMRSTADFAVTKYSEHRANGAQDFLLGCCEKGQLLIGGGK